MTDNIAQRSNAALSAKAAAALGELKTRFPFAEDRDAARLAFSFAVSEGLSTTDRDGFGPMTGGINWNVNTLDPSGELAQLVGLLWPDEPDPYRVVETLMNAGMLALAERLAEDPSLKASDLLVGDPA
jgi:hypothetical protein